MTGTETVLDLRDVSVLQAGPGQLLVHMHAAGLNRGEFVLGHGLHGQACSWGRRSAQRSLGRRDPRKSWRY